jgi:hypothetical protein
MKENIKEEDKKNVEEDKKIVKETDIITHMKHYG